MKVMAMGILFWNVRERSLKVSTERKWEIMEKAECYKHLYLKYIYKIRSFKYSLSKYIPLEG